MLLKHGADNAIPLSPEVLKNHQPMVKKGKHSEYTPVSECIPGQFGRTQGDMRVFQALQKMNGQWIYWGFPINSISDKWT